MRTLPHLLKPKTDEKDFYNQLVEVRKEVGDRAILRAIHLFNENKRVEKSSIFFKKIMILIRLDKLLKIQEILHINTYKTFIQINIQIIKLFL